MQSRFVIVRPVVDCRFGLFSLVEISLTASSLTSFRTSIWEVKLRHIIHSVVLPIQKCVWCVLVAAVRRKYPTFRPAYEKVLRISFPSPIFLHGTYFPLLIIVSLVVHRLSKPAYTLFLCNFMSIHKLVYVTSVEPCRRYDLFSQIARQESLTTLHGSNFESLRSVLSRDSNDFVHV